MSIFIPARDLSQTESLQKSFDSLLADATEITGLNTIQASMGNFINCSTGSLTVSGAGSIGSLTASGSISGASISTTGGITTAGESTFNGVVRINNTPAAVSTYGGISSDAGFLTATNGYLSVSSTGAFVPTTAGAYICHNRSSSTGRTSIVNHRGNQSGGFIFEVFNSSNTAISNPIVINGDNVLFVRNAGLSNYDSTYYGLMVGVNAGGFASDGSSVTYGNGSAARRWRVGAAIGSEQFYFSKNNGSSYMVIATIDSSGTYSSQSDARLKKDIEPCHYGLADINKLEPKCYRFIDADADSPKNIGLIAQDVIAAGMASIVKSFEREPGITRYSLNYTELIPVLINAVKELSARLTSAEAQLAELNNF